MSRQRAKASIPKLPQVPNELSNTLISPATGLNGIPLWLYQPRSKLEPQHIVA